ncbi:DNA repair protein RadA [Rummeliibacillus sp. G93]|uniref:DNA repair protein RadA n=1 Tax=Rummeliibacillus TaxID=648802 RepID=UPI0011707033|nr:MULTISPECIES: DNA repair protein RadA [Rummeliibacillus]MBB5171254.1 DNA repair protein RadA/Sms [Rummeliibacillus stabekisii]MCM3317658.1 DNA repair protein RadA [Rummeliibacillus stabekisii]UQW97351.1 DNA repair protein RadA [Rummeliibacillus sp. G93]GEL06043.1 DNA repair protein RadA [Rummeliibacillus stabekisii]
MAKKKTKFFCNACGYESPKWLGRCPGCGDWNTMVEEVEVVSKGPRGAFQHSSSVTQKATPLIAVETEDAPRIETELNELNRVLGGGIVPGSLVLIGGDPGIGKSTLLLQVSAILSNKGHRVLYISGEESIRQTKLRAERLGVKSEELYIYSETNLEFLNQTIEEVNPKFVIVDSIQTVYHPNVTSAPGSVSQVRECTAEFMRIAKTKNIAIFLVGHVTKEGQIAGPRILEHMVDTVLYFEGERHHTYRILRSQKNRFGSTNEIAIFEMLQNGLKEVLNPSELFLQERSQGAPGSTVVASMEGTRPILVEVQALVTPSSFNYPKRMATGVDQNRISLLMAVLEKRMGMLLQAQDAYIKVAGGVKLDEPAIDLAVLVSIVSSFRDTAAKPMDCYIGEVGLTGEVRRVSRIEQRIQEAAKLGFKRAIVPASNLGGFEYPDTIEVVGVDTVNQALKLSFDKA